MCTGNWTDKLTLSLQLEISLFTLTSRTDVFDEVNGEEKMIEGHNIPDDHSGAANPKDTHGLPAFDVRPSQGPSHFLFPVGGGTGDPPPGRPRAKWASRVHKLRMLCFGDEALHGPVARRASRLHGSGGVVLGSRKGGSRHIVRLHAGNAPRAQTAARSSQESPGNNDSPRSGPSSWTTSTISMAMVRRFHKAYLACKLASIDTGNTMIIILTGSECCSSW